MEIFCSATAKISDRRSGIFGAHAPGASICGVKRRDFAGFFAFAASIHRASKKSVISRLFAFDFPKPRTYNPRPRCFAAVAEKRCSPLKLDAKIV